MIGITGLSPDQDSREDATAATIRNRNGEELVARSSIGEGLATIHDVVSSRVYAPLFQASLLVRAATRDAERAFRAGLRARITTARWSDEQRRHWVLQRLRDSVRAAAALSAYYREAFARTGFDPAADFDFEDFAALPILERDTVRENQDALINQTLRRSRLRRDATGGSSGVPTEIWLGPEERGWRQSGIRYFHELAGVGAGARVLYLWGHHLDPIATDSLKARAKDWLENVTWRECLRLSPATLTRYHRECQELQPACIIAYASAVAMLAEAAALDGEPPLYPTRCIITGAEKLYEHERRSLERTYGRPVHERYGSRDVGLIGFQCSPSETLDFTVDWMNVLVEPETIGESASILVTKLHADGMPMIRYRVGDEARFPSGARPGHPSFSMMEVLGRDTDHLCLPDGATVSGISFPHMLKDFPVAEFQAWQAADYDVTLRLVPKSALSAEMQAEILRIVRANLPGLPVTLELVPHIARTVSNKRRPVICDVRRGRPMEV